MRVFLQDFCKRYQFRIVLRIESASGCALTGEQQKVLFCAPACRSEVCIRGSLARGNPKRRDAKNRSLATRLDEESFAPQ